MTELYIGLMSGTSLDGVDGVLVDFAASGPDLLHVVAHAHRPFAPALAAELLALNDPGGANELHRAALAGNALARGYAEVIEAVLTASGTPRDRVRAVGAHGQTVRHRPREFDGTGYTLQLNSPALLAELCGIDVVADLRSRDLAAGGQGAPLASGFHRAMFGRAGEAVAVLNLGGIGNLTALRADGSTIGFDCGPANALLDHWCRLHTGRAYDDGGAWAASGRVIDPLLERLLTEPYFALPPPKSTGRDLFNPDWLQARLAASDPGAAPVDVQATLAELSAAACAADVQAHAPGARVLLVCGGGAHNADLMRRLAVRLPGVDVMRTDQRGLPADQVEACAFAWLARACVRRECANVPRVTGAAGPRVLGALYPAR
ncbi:MAG TPA: anhydro-N-acetylmuramic acid kinase [Burkholderiaceae bacterium]|nr:anhydro-N-acetylmuramic acid kinase [Burkholderiaceae bacterium]